MSTNSNYLVLIQQYGSAGSMAPLISVQAPIPESVNFDLDATYETPLPQTFTKNGLVNGIAGALGMRMAVQALTAQLWTGSTTGDLSLQLEFHTENDPIIDVRNNIVNLMKLVTPSINPAAGLLQSPGPSFDIGQTGQVAGDTASDIVSSVKGLGGGLLNSGKNILSDFVKGSGLSDFGVGSFKLGQMVDSSSQTTDGANSAIPKEIQQNPQLGTAEYWKSQVKNRISIRLGNYMYFDNVVVTHLGHTFSSNFDAVTGFPHHVIVTLNFRPMFVLSQSDLDNVILSPGNYAGYTPGSNNYGFTIPDSVKNAASNVVDQFGLSNVFGLTG